MTDFLKPTDISAPSTLPSEPNWVGTSPQSDHYTLKNYLDDIADEDRLKSSQLIKNVIKKIFKDRGMEGPPIREVKVEFIGNAGNEADVIEMLRSGEVSHE